jgi:hypothetical protein
LTTLPESGIAISPLAGARLHPACLQHLGKLDYLVFVIRKAIGM